MSEAGTAVSTEGVVDQPRPLAAAERAAVVEMLVRAFFEDPAFVWVLPDPASRAARMRWLGHRWIRVRQQQGDPLLVEPARGFLVGVSPTGNPDVPFWSQVKVGLLGMPFVYGARSFRRFLAVDADVKRRHARELTEPHTIIDILAVDPAAQGCGVGTGLLHRYLQAADQQQLPAYLITHNPRNLAFYQRSGFQVIREAPVAPGAVLGWSMRRPPSHLR
jgi:GNAT superfamily N-acetyltransferase